MKFSARRGSNLVSYALIIAGCFINVAPRATAKAQGSLVRPNPTSLQFGSVPVGNVATLTETVTNIGNVDINATSYTVSGSEYSVSGLSFPLTLEPGHSITFTSTFTPTTGGASNGAINLYATKGKLVIPLFGTGTTSGTLVITPASVNFGNVVVGKSGTQNASMQATGGSVTVTAATVDNPEFGASGLTFPFTLQPGQSMPFSVSFAPTQTGLATANLSFANAPNSPAIELLSGTGTTAPPPPSVLLSWNASTSQVVGYNVFRSNTAGGPYTQLNSSTDPNTAYTDTNVNSKQTYYYVTTAVNSAGQQSVYSNQVQAVIP